MSSPSIAGTAKIDRLRTIAVLHPPGTVVRIWHGIRAGATATPITTARRRRPSQNRGPKNGRSITVRNVWRAPRLGQCGDDAVLRHHHEPAIVALDGFDLAEARQVRARTDFKQYAVLALDHGAT